MTLRDSSEALFTKMRTLADTGHPRAGELRAKAGAFEAAAAEFYGSNGYQPRGRAMISAFLSTWASARGCYLQCNARDPSLPKSWT